VLTGDWLAGDSKRKVAGMFAFGVVGILAGELWGIWFPINKKLWTSSFVLFTAGCALVCLAACYWLNDVRLHRGAWTKPFVAFGTNAIAAYALAELLESLLLNVHVHVGRNVLSLQDYLYRIAFGGVSPRELGSLLYAIAFVCICWLPIYWMYRRQIFLKA
jgi:predicted acyltransferase